MEISPKEKGIDVRDELLKFHDIWYSSNIMAVAVLGKGNKLDIIREYFNLKTDLGKILATSNVDTRYFMKIVPSCSN